MDFAEILIFLFFTIISIVIKSVKEKKAIEEKKSQNRSNNTKVFDMNPPPKPKTRQAKVKSKSRTNVDDLGGWQTSLEEERLVTSGPYALVRNPCYVGSFLAGLGLAVMSGRWLAYVVLLGFTVLGMTRLVPGEEALLGEQFGLAYEAYYQAVPRYLPGWRQFGKWLRARRQGTEPDQRFGSRDAWLAERYMLIFLAGVILAMVVRWRF